jgi:alanyl-tRNA synthetase
MLKYTVDNLEAIDEAARSFYKETSNGYVLDVDVELKGDSDEAEKLKLHNQKVLEEKKKAQEALRALRDEIEQEKEARSKQSGDFESLLKSSEEKRAKLESSLSELKQKTAEAARMSEVNKFAAKLCDGTNQQLLTPFASKRISINDDGATVVLDKSGNATVMTLDDLADEIRSDEMFKPIIRGTKASGGGASGGLKGAVSDNMSAKISKNPMGAAMDYFSST